MAPRQRQSCAGSRFRWERRRWWRSDLLDRLVRKLSLTPSYFLRLSLDYRFFQVSQTLPSVRNSYPSRLPGKDYIHTPYTHKVPDHRRSPGQALAQARQQAAQDPSVSKEKRLWFRYVGTPGSPQALISTVLYYN